MPGMAQENPWYAVHVRHKHERLVSSLLESKGYNEFNPTYRSRRRWSDRTAEIQLPLFPGYVFCQFDPSDRRAPVVATPGVIRIIGAVHPAEMAAVQAVIASGLAVEPWPCLEPGELVRIHHGPLAGVEGVFLELKNRHRLIVSISLLRRSINVDVDSAMVAPARQCA